MNILSTNGLVGRYVTDWAGPGAVLTDVNIRLGAPNYPDDTMTLTGSVTAKDDAARRRGEGVRRGDPQGRQQAGRPRDRHGPAPPARRRCPMSGTNHAFVGNTAIAGIGATEFSKESGRSELRLAVEAVDLALRDAGIEPSEVDGLVTFSSDTNPEIDIARSLGMGELSFFSRIHYGGGAGVRHDPAGGAGRRGRGGRCRRLLPGVQRALGKPVRCRRPGAPAGGQRRDGPLRLVRAPGAAHPGPVGGHGRAAVPACDRGDVRGPGTGGGGRPQARRHQSEGLVLRKADHPGGAPELPVDRGAPPPPRLLPGDRRGTGPRGHLARAGPRPAEHAGGHPGRGPGSGTGPGDDDVVLLRQPDRARRDDGGGPPAVGDIGALAGGHPDGGHLRPLHPAMCSTNWRSSGSAPRARPRTS